MRLTLLAAVFLFTLHTCLATVPGSISVPGFVALPVDPAAKAPVRNAFQAARGFKIWGMVVISCALLAAAAALKDNGDSVSNLLTVLWANP